MPTETSIIPKKIWEKLLIYWQTKNLSKQTYDIALIIAVAIYTDEKIYEEELYQARQILHKRLKHKGSVDNIIDYIEHKLYLYTKDQSQWKQDLQTCRNLIKNKQELYVHFLDIFTADEDIDEKEAAFELSLKKMLMDS